MIRTRPSTETAHGSNQGFAGRWGAARGPARNSPALHLTPDGESAGPRHLVGAGAKAPASQSPTSAATGCAIELRSRRILAALPLKLVSGRAEARPRANVQSVTRAPPGCPLLAPAMPARAAAGQSPFPHCHASATLLLPNPSVNLTRYGRRRLAAPGVVSHFPSAASRRQPPLAGYLKR